MALAIRHAVREGELPAGARLPAVRDLAWRLKVTPGTVARAYQLAARDGLIDSHVGRGSFVRGTADPALQPMLTVRSADALRDDGPVDLRLPQLPDVGQVAAIRAAMHAVA
ncbi:MAG TPA: GntR family transcriptional regulator, partial [Paracoccus sp. (in: a-proteobacteria)]|nr:GntR family transcriptional regulator [Paracoccus sp. (in: a-proteobacteria)]